MPPSLRCQLFGALALWQVSPAGEEALGLPGGETAQSLLAYLLLHGRQPLSRLRLAGLFWPELSEALALRQLSQTLWKIRKTLPDLVQVSPGQIALASQAELSIDVETFASLLETSAPDEAGALRQAVFLYCGDLLEGLYQDWVIEQREALRERYLQALSRLVAQEKLAGRMEAALEAALRLAHLEPLTESFQREVMRLDIALGRPEAALRQFEACQRQLQSELGVAPEPETLALVAEISTRLSQAMPADPVSLAAPASQPSLGAPVATYLPPAQPVAAAEPLAALPLVGRDAERRQLLSWLDAALGGAGGVILLEGEAGVGKTRLLQEFARDAAWRGAQVLWTGFEQSGGASAYHAFSQGLGAGLTPLRRSQLVRLAQPAWLAVLQRALPELALAGEPAPALADPARERDRLGYALGELLRLWSQVVPLVCLLEDLHWAEPDALHALSAAAPILRLSRVLLVCSQRGEEIRAAPARRAALEGLLLHSLAPPLPLPRLEAPACAELVRRWLGLTAAAPRFEARLFQETEGNPLFVLETLRTLHDEGLLTRVENGEWQTPWDQTTRDYAELPLPSAVESVIARRLAGLEASERQLLQVAAVLGDEFDFDLLAAIMDEPLEALLQRLAFLRERQFLLEMADCYRFSHDKVRQVAYEALPAAERSGWHRRAAAALESLQPENATRLAWHAFRGEDWPLAARYNELAADQAATSLAFQTALEHYLRAIQAQAAVGSPTAADLFRLHQHCEQAAGRTGDWAVQLGSLKTLESLLSQPGLDSLSNRCLVQERWTRYWYVQADYEKALGGVQGWVELARQIASPPAEFEALLLWGRMLREHGDYPGARQRFEAALALAEAGQAHPQASAWGERARLDALTELSVLEFNAGQYGPAQARIEDALPAARRLGDQNQSGYLCGRLGAVFHYLADFPQALAYNAEAVQVARLLGDRNREISELYNRSTILLDMGDCAGARGVLEEVCQADHQLGNRRVESYGWVFLGLVLEYQGDYPRSREAYLEGLRLRREVGLQALAVDPLAGLARVDTALGDYVSAVAWADQALNWLEAHGAAGVGDAVLAYLGIYRALLAAGQEARGRAVLQTAYSLLMEYAATISDLERQQAYLHDINPGREVWQDYQRLHSRRITVSLAHASAPLGRPLRPEEWTPVTWTVEAPEDQALLDKGERRRARLLRLAQEAAAQQAVPTAEDLADALGVSLATLKRDLAVLRAAGQAVKTRRN